MILRDHPKRRGRLSGVGVSLAVFLPILLAVCLTSRSLSAQMGQEMARASAAEVTPESTLPTATLQLFQAVEVNDLPGVKSAIDGGANLDAKNSNGKTPADLAVDKGHFIIAHFLLSERGKASKVKPLKRRAQKVTAKPKPAPVKTAKSLRETIAGLTHGGKYGYPPRKPLDSMVGEELPEALEIGESPGLRTGRVDPRPDPFKSPEQDADLPMIENAATESSPPKSPMKAADGEKSANTVSSFFQSLVDIVTPSGPSSTKPAAPQKMVEPVTDTLANTETAEMPVMETPASPVIEAVMKKPADAPKVIRKVAPAQPITRQAPEIAEEIPGTTTSRALSRLKGLVEDAPEENAFGLPKLATDGPSRRSASPGVQAPDLAEDNILNPTTSDDVLGTLERLRTALSRDITTNPMEVLKASRRAGAERMAKLLDQIKTVPPDTSLLRSRVLSPTQPEPVQPQKKASVDEFINDLADIRREPPRAVGPDRPIENTASVDADITDALLRDSAPPTEPVSEPLAPEGQPLNFEDRVTRIKRQAYAEEEILQKAAEDAAKDAKAADDAKAKQPLSDEQKKAMTVDALARYFKDEPDAKARMDGVSAEGYRTAPNIGQLNEPSEPTGKGLAAKALAAVGEPPSGQTVGKMNPGFLDKLARLFSNEEPAETGWSAQVEVDDPTPPTGLTAGGGTPAQQVPEVAQTGWTTSVELNAGDGNSVLLGVTETPVDRPVDVIEPVQPPPETAQQEPAAVAKQPTTPPVAALPAPDQTLAELDLPPVEPELPEIVAEPEPKPQPKPQPKLEPVTEGNILEQIEARLRKREGLPPLEPDARGNRFDSGPEATAPAEARGLDAALYKLDELTPPTDSLDAKLGSLDEPTSKLDDSLDAAFGEPTEITAPVDKSLDAAFGEPVTESTVEAAESPKPGTAKRARRSAPPTLPYSDPLRAPVATTAAKSLPPLPTPRVTRAMPLRQPSAAEEAAQRAMHLERQEALTTGYPTPGQVAANQPASAPTLWPVTELAKNDSPTKPARPARPSMLSRTTLTGVQMSLGESVTLENSLPPEGGIDPNNECVKKNRGTTLFCIEPIDWPASISDKFQVPTILYTGPMAIVRFDQGTATRLHALFPSDDFEAVSAFYQTRYGTPTELWKRSIAPLAEPRRDNPTIAWRSRDPKTNVVSILELRKYDDTRGGFPDTNRGAVMLYTANSPPIFPQVSSHELMRIGRLKQAEGG